MLKGYTFFTFKDFLNSLLHKQVVLRHDVDLLPENSLRFAKIQSGLGIKGTYFFRAVPESWDENIIKEIDTILNDHFKVAKSIKKGSEDEVVKKMQLDLYWQI